MKPIGGYFGLHTGGGSLPHTKAFPVNFGRGGLGESSREIYRQADDLAVEDLRR